ncbi:MAG: hypothetical protein KGL34_02530 [Gammaproteobacteria bacterium]|nr:hypothetical protein [Gammaproteobacteria bacterium]
MANTVRRGRPIVVLSAWVAIVLAGCSTPPTAPAANYRWVDIPIRFDYSLIAPRYHHSQPDVTALRLFAIPGAIQGSDDGGPLADLRVQAGHAVLEMNTIQTAIAVRARPLSRDAHAGGLRIEPPNTRLARVAPMPLTLDYQMFGSGSRFEDADTGDGLILAYFDRPCRLFGRLDGTGLKGERLVSRFDVTVARPGLVWLELVRSPDRHTFEINSVAVSARPVFIDMPR